MYVQETQDNDSTPGRKRRRGGNKSPVHGNEGPRQVIAVLGRPTFIQFPGLEDTHFEDTVTDGAATHACGVLREHFEEKEVLKARVNFMLYQARVDEVVKDPFPLPR